MTLEALSLIGEAHAYLSVTKRPISQEKGLSIIPRCSELRSPAVSIWIKSGLSLDMVSLVILVHTFPPFFRLGVFHSKRMTSQKIAIGLVAIALFGTQLKSY